MAEVESDVVNDVETVEEEDLLTEAADDEAQCEEQELEAQSEALDELDTEESNNVANEASSTNEGEVVFVDEEPMEQEEDDEVAEMKNETNDAETKANEEMKAKEEAYEAEKAAEKLANKESAAELAEKERRRKEHEAEKQARKVDLNVMPQVNVANLGTRRFQVKLYPLRPSDFINGNISATFRLANESLLYMYTVGRMSNGKAELYMSTFNKMLGVMQKLLKLEYHSPETNVRIIRKDEDNTVAEKGLIRFDAKEMRKLWMLSETMKPPGRKGGKRERIIGSVFVKNLPETTTKDMLRLMFPFAAEINYNPEKFKDGAARLVLTNRGAVGPCLKAFSRVELNGRVLEIRPLEKRKKEAETDKTDGAAKPGPVSAGTKEKTVTAAKTESPDKKTPAKSSPQNGEAKKDSTPQNKSPTKAVATVGAAVKKSRVRQLAERRRQQARELLQRNKQRLNRPGGFGRVNNRGMAGRPGGPARGALAGRFNEGIMPGRPDPTENMMHLQAQLSAAIHNQLTMLNQTQMAVEKVKREAALSAVNRATEFVTPGPPIGMSNVEQRRQQPASSPRNRGGLQNRRRRSRGNSESLDLTSKRTANDAGFSDFQEDDMFFRAEKRNFGSQRGWAQSNQAERQRLQQERQLLQQRKDQEERQLQERQERQRQLQLMEQRQQMNMQQKRGQQGGMSQSRGQNRRRQQKNRKKDSLSEDFESSGQLQGFQQRMRMQQQRQNYGSSNYGLADTQSYGDLQSGRAERSTSSWGFGDTGAYGNASASSKVYGLSPTAGKAYGTSPGKVFAGGRNFGTGARNSGAGARASSYMGFNTRSQNSYDADYDWQGY